MNVLAALVALVVCVSSAPFVIAWLRRRSVLDVPVARSSHTVPTPRGGGIAPAAGCVVATVVLALHDADATLLAVAGVASAFGIVGFIDDLHGVSARARLAAQLAIAMVGGAALVFAAGVDGLVVATVTAGAGAFWLVGYVNAFNFMDGINGMSSMQAIVAGSMWAVVGHWADEPAVASAGIVVAAAAAGFLPFNLPRARVFLGDVGSYFLGAWLGATALVGVALGISPVAMIAPLVLYLADTGLTLLRRARRRAKLTEAHREHAYQLLVASGWSHAQVALTAGGVMVVSSVVGLATVDAGPLGQIAGGAMLLTMAIAFVLLPALGARSRRPTARPTVDGGR